jgi:predicted O-methyltransferase YrrM
MHLTRRQVAVLGAASVVGVALIVAAAFDRLAVAVALCGALGVLSVVCLVQLRRRLAETQRRLDEAVHRILGRLGNEAARVDTTVTGRLESVERRQDAAAEGLVRQQRALDRSVERSTRQVMRHQREQTAEFEALLQLFAGFTPRAPMPPTGSWALNPSGMLEVLHRIRRQRPKNVLELGSGTSTVWIAYALEQIGGRLVSLDHDDQYAGRTSAALALHGLEGVAEVRTAPLEAVHVGGSDYRWYNLHAFADLDEVDFLLVDGPPGTTGPRARFPAVPLLEHKLSATATVVLDDAERSDEADVVRQWTDAVAGLSREYNVYGRQAVMRYARH